jgi:hypothetical protein
MICIRFDIESERKFLLKNEKFYSFGAKNVLKI